MNPFHELLLQKLAAARAAEDGKPRFLSGASLAAEHGVTRSAVWKAVGRLRELGTQVEAITHRGYRLALPASPLATAGVLAQMHASTRARLRSGECAAQVESTNSVLLSRGAPPPGSFDFLTAEHQSAGRGRRGRGWLAAPGSAICLSWSWCFEGLPAQGAPSLAIGVSALRALRRAGVEGVQLKWPNDLVCPQGKLGGILIEMRSEAGGPAHVVVGLGLNMALDVEARARIHELGNMASDLAQITGNRPPLREGLVAALLDEGVAALDEFARRGLAPFLAEYRDADSLAGCNVLVAGGGGPEAGVARGIDDDGALLVEHDGAIHRIIAGEVSVRRT